MPGDGTTVYTYLHMSYKKLEYVPYKEFLTVAKELLNLLSYWFLHMRMTIYCCIFNTVCEMSNYKTY